MTWSTFILMLAYSSAAYDQPSQRRLNTYYHASFYNCYYGSFLGKLLESTGMVLKIFVTSSDWETLSRVSEVLPWTRSNRFCNMLPSEKASPNKYYTCDGFEMVGFLEVLFNLDLVRYILKGLKVPPRIRRVQRSSILP